MPGLRSASWLREWLKRSPLAATLYFARDSKMSLSGQGAYENVCRPYKTTCEKPPASGSDIKKKHISSEVWEISDYICTEKHLLRCPFVHENTQAVLQFGVQVVINTT